MEIAGVEVNPKMLAIGGAAGLGLIVMTMKGRGGGGQDGQTVTLSPGNGLNWSDVVADPNDRGRLIGPGGPIGRTRPSGGTGSARRTGGPGSRDDPAPGGRSGRGPRSKQTTAQSAGSAGSARSPRR
jgi:hypothetical protein